MNGHVVGNWSSQPVIRRMNVGDLLLCSSIVMSGNNYHKIKLLSTCLNLAMVSSSTFHRIQNRIINPVIKVKWDEMQKQNIQKAKALGRPVILKGKV